MRKPRHTSLPGWEQAYRYIIQARYQKKLTVVYLHSPQRFPMFSTAEQATEFRWALAEIMDKSLGLALETTRRKWPMRGIPFALVDEKPLLLNPDASECKRALIYLGLKAIPLVA